MNCSFLQFAKNYGLFSHEEEGASKKKDFQKVFSRLSPASQIASSLSTPSITPFFSAQEAFSDRDKERHINVSIIPSPR